MAKLTATDRKEIPKKNALARSSGKSVAPQVKAAVKKKFPSMGQGGGLKGFVAKKGMV